MEPSFNVELLDKDYHIGRAPAFAPAKKSSQAWRNEAVHSPTGKWGQRSEPDQRLVLAATRLKSRDTVCPFCDQVPLIEVPSASTVPM
jgi:hypothetical protein